METDDLIVIGAGIAGLIAARNAARLGAKVRVLEASNRAGGQIWSIFHDATRQHIALGAEWLNLNKHECLYKEKNHYDIQTDHFVHKNQYMLYDGKGDKAKVSELHKLMNQLRTDALFASALTTMNWDASFIVFKDGYNQPDSEQYDMPFEQYCLVRLALPPTSLALEFIIAQAFHLTGGNPLTQSALGVLYVIAGFRTAEKAFSLDHNILHRYPQFLGTLVSKIVEEFQALGGIIEFNKPVVSVRKEEMPVPTPKVPNYDYPPLPTRKRTVFVKCTSKEEFTTRSVIMAVSLKCISNIRFDPPIPLALSQASERCNAGTDQIKMYAFAAGVSSDIQRLLTVQYECRETYTIGRHYKYNPTTVYTTGAHSSDAMLSEASAAAISSSRISRRTLTASYHHSKNSRPSSGNDDHLANHTLVCTNGSRHELMKNIARNLRKIHPVIELPNDKQSCTPSASRPSTTVSTSNSSSNTRPGLLPAAVGAVPADPSLYAAVRSPSPADTVLRENTSCVVAVNTSNYIVSHDDAVLYHDFLSDVCIRGTWFNLRAGTAHLHVLATKAARMPWQGRDKLVDAQGAHLPKQLVEVNYSSDRTLVPDDEADLSLIIACGELNSEWTGWVEGAVRAGAEAAKRVHPYLFPPMVARNFAKKAVQSPVKQIVLPPMSPTQRRRERLNTNL